MGLLRGIAGFVSIISGILAALSIFTGNKISTKIAEFTSMGVLEFLVIGFLAMMVYVFFSED